MIDSYKYRRVATFNVTGEYLQTDLPKENFTLLLLEGKILDIMCDINPKYRQHVRFKDGRKTVYIHILK